MFDTFTAKEQKSSPKSAPSAPPDDSTCPECGKSLLRCEYCGQFSDEPHACADPSWYNVGLFSVVLERPGLYSEGDGFWACPRCPGHDEDGHEE